MSLGVEKSSGGRRGASEGVAPTSETTPRSARDQLADLFVTLNSQHEAAAPELSFLRAFGVPDNTLKAVQKRADVLGVEPLDYMLREGLVRDDDYYAALAERLGVKFIRHGVQFAADICPFQALEHRAGRLTIGENTEKAIFAPGGRLIQLMLKQEGPPGTRSFAVTTPRRLAGMIRRQFGDAISQDASENLPRVRPCASAKFGASRAQGTFALLVLFAATFCFIAAPRAFAFALNSIFWIIFSAGILLRFLASTSTSAAQETVFAVDSDLPVYTILVPLYREAAVLPHLIRALERLDYPKAKLDLKLLLEIDDDESLSVLKRMRLPARYEIIVAPLGGPRTKPRALNVALRTAEGEFVAVYDAEDDPDPLQLKVAVAQFRASPAIDCLQGRLAIANPDESWLTRAFALEYAALFDLVNPGLAALGAPIALGGTTNHFRREALTAIGGWDAWNVTEDADLGLRLAREGRVVAALDSDTWEEAPITFRAWFRQRMRWQKGWLQTFVVHTRSPRALVRELGPMRAAAALTLIGGVAAGSLFGPILAVPLVRRLVGVDLSGATSLDVLGEVFVYVLAICGLMAAIIPAFVAGRKRGYPKLGLTLLTFPAYYLLISAAAWAAVFDWLLRPHHWMKTEHGISKTRRIEGA